MSGSSQFLLNIVILARTITVQIQSDNFMYKVQFYVLLVMNSC